MSNTPCKCKKQCGDDPDVQSGKLTGCSGYQQRKLKEKSEYRSYFLNLLRIKSSTN